MTRRENDLFILSCLDSAEIAAARRRELDIPRDLATALGRSAVEAGVTGYYFTRAGEKVDLARLVNTACSAKRSIPSDAPLPKGEEGSGSGKILVIWGEICRCLHLAIQFPPWMVATLLKESVEKTFTYAMASSNRSSQPAVSLSNGSIAILRLASFAQDRRSV